MKRFLAAAAIVLLITAGTVFAGGQQDGKNVELTFMINFQSYEAVTAALEEVVEKFNSEDNGITVELIPGTSDYEAIMKTKMATNDLPDLWSTHGWSVIRYSEYLAPLEDQEWATRLHPAIKPVITDDDGRIFVLPLDVDMAGIAYNKDVVKLAGVDVSKIKTWKDLTAAMEKVKAAGITPVHIGGRDNWTIGNFFDWAAPAVFITDDKNYSGDDLLSGRFDSGKWEILAGIFSDMQKNGYLNKDCLTSAYSDSARALAVGDAAFTFYGNYVIAEAWTFVPDANIGFFPVPAYYEGDEPSLISGERTTVGIWKDTQYPEECRIFLEYLARPENAALVASANGIPAGLVDAESDTGRLKEDYELWGETSSFPYFDRAFLPSGMWDTMCSTGAGILAGDMSTKQAAGKVKEDFDRMYK